MRRLVTVALLIAACACAQAAEGRIKLSEPDTQGGKPLMQCLAARRTARTFAPRPLAEPVLSNLLWAAFGVNRAESGKRTAPSAVNWQEIDIYVATEAALYRYDAPAHALEAVLGEDIRPETGRQDFTAVAPAVLVYVADFDRMRGANADQQVFYSAADTGFISQNVYLYAASEGLSTVVIGLVDKPALKERMGLRASQRVILCQPVGYPPAE